MSMNDALLKELSDRLTEFEFKERAGYLRGGICPSCRKKELWTHAESPWVVKCGRLNNCGYEAHVKELYPDLFENWSKRYATEQTTNPNAAADAYLAIGRGFDIARLRGAYTQENFFDPARQIGSATVRFKVANTWWERLIDQPERFGKMKAHIQRGGTFRGQWWTPPGLDLTQTEELWLVEGIFDAIALWHHGVAAAANISCSNYPHEALAKLLEERGGNPVKLVFAYDGDKAGRDYMRKHVTRARTDGWPAKAAFIGQQGQRKQDWNDLHMLDRSEPDATKHRLGTEGLKDYLYNGALLMAQTATEKAMLMYGHNPKRSEFEFEFGRRLYWFSLNVDAYHRALDRIAEEHPDMDPEQLREQAMQESGGIRQIANCHPYPLYYQANRITDESWYYFRVEFPHDGGAVKNTFTSAQLSSASEFKKRLLAIAPGAMYSGSNMHLDRALERQLYAIKQVETVDYTGYSREYGCYILGKLAVAKGKVHKINDEDYFDMGKLSVKTLSQSVNLQINDDRTEYDRGWIEPMASAFGAKGLAALTFWFGSLFAEQIRASQKSFPFLEIVGEAGSGKTTLIEFMWKLFGRQDYEGFDPSKSTAAARARNFAQVSGMPVVLIESDREQTGENNPKVRAFDWDELKTAYNGRSVRSRGVANGGNETYEPPFRGAIVISQNNPVSASDAVMTRIVHLYFDRSTQSRDTAEAAKLLERMPMDTVSGFILAATLREAQILELVDEKAPMYERQLLQDPEIRTVRIAKCHGQLLALADALRLVVRLSDEQHQQLRLQILAMAKQREQAIDSDHPMVQEFWDMYYYLNGDEEKPTLNHARSPQEIALNLNHVLQVAIEHKQQMPPLRELKALLKTSKRHRYMGQKVVNSAIKARELKNISTSERCWVFEKGVTAK
jgi:hypothetical protein